MRQRVLHKAARFIGRHAGGAIIEAARLQRRIDQGRIEAVAHPAGADEHQLGLDLFQPDRFERALKARQGLDAAAGGMVQNIGAGQRR